MTTDIAVIVRAIAQSGLAPKVKLPAAALAAIGVILTVLGIVVPDLDTLIDVGLAIVGASGVTLGVGVAAPAGDVIVRPADVAVAETVSAAHASDRATVRNEAGVTDVVVLAFLVGAAIALLIVFLLAR